MILVIGDVMLDRYWVSDITGMANEAPVACVKVKESNDYPGGAANVANNIASLGQEVSILGLTAADENKIILENKLTTLNVKTIFLDKLNATTTKLRIIAKDNQVVRVDFEDSIAGSESLLKVKDLSENQEIQNILKNTKIVVLSDYAKGVLFDIKNIIKYLKENYPLIKILVDPKDNDVNKYSNIFLLKPNFKEAQEMLGECKNIDELTIKSQKFIEKHNITNLLVTLGKDGMILFRPYDKPYHIASRANEVFDVTGAGDTVLASIACALKQDYTIEEALDMASTAASIAVSKLGTVCLDLNYIQNANTHKKLKTDKIINIECKEQLSQDIKKAGKKLYIFEENIELIDSNLIDNFKKLKQENDLLWVKLDKKSEPAKNNVHNLDVKIEILKNLKSVDGIMVI